MTDEKPMKELGVAADPADHWAARMAEAIAQGKRCFVNPKTGHIKVSE